jgi:hypothetical protein
MTAYQKPKGLLRGQGLGFKKRKIYIYIGQNTHHNKRDNTTLHKERPKTTAYQGSNT